MNVRYMFSLIAVIVLFLIAWAGAAVGLQFVFGIIIPYLALITFLVGLTIFCAHFFLIRMSLVSNNVVLCVSL